MGYFETGKRLGDVVEADKILSAATTIVEAWIPTGSGVGGTASSPGEYGALIGAVLGAAVKAIADQQI